MRLVSFLLSLVPALTWIPKYTLRNIPGDLAAGLTGGVLYVAQGLSYASLAGLPPVFGLYTSLVPVVVYFLLGSCPHQSVGPVAIVALLVGSAVERETAAHFAGAVHSAEAEVSVRVAIAGWLSFAVGGVLLLLWVFRLGIVANFLSQPVLVGFTNGSAVLLAVSQLKDTLGIKISASASAVSAIRSAIEQRSHVNGWAALVALSSFAFLVAMSQAGKKWPRLKMFPWVVVVVVIATSITYAQRLDQGTARLKVIGKIPSGLSIASVPEFSLALLRATIVDAVLIALIMYVSSISTAKVLARRYGYAVASNQELFALGVSNVVGAFFSSFPPSGGLGRTAVLAASGAKTLASSLLSVLIVLFTLLFLTPLFYYTPKAVLAGIVLASVISLTAIKDPIHFWRVDRKDFFVFAVAATLTFFLGISLGLLLSVVVSLVLFLVATSRPHSTVLGLVPNTRLFRNVKRFPSAICFPGRVFFRFDAPLYFANADHLKDCLVTQGAAAAATASPGQAPVVVLDMTAISFVDATGLSALEDAKGELDGMDVRLALTNVIGPVRDTIVRAAGGSRSFSLDADTYADNGSALEALVGKVAVAAAAGAVDEARVASLTSGNSSVGLDSYDSWPFDDDESALDKSL